MTKPQLALAVPGLKVFVLKMPLILPKPLGGGGP